jgi:hypothetical protein
MKASFLLSGKCVEGEVIRENPQTVVVKYNEPEDKGGKLKIFRRHKARHQVVYIKDETKFVGISMEKSSECKCSDECKCSAE